MSKPHNQPDGNEVILVVEDLTDARDTLRMFLELCGYRVETASDGETGLDVLLEGHTDLAIIDIGLPGMDGYEVTRRVRAAGLTTPLIALTGYATKSDREQAATAGFNAHLAKPASPDELVEAINQLLPRA